MRIEIRNVLGVDRADIDIGGVTLLAGLNFAGKTSILRAIAAAASADSCPVHHADSTQEKPKPAFKKKDYKQFVRLGADRASVIISTKRGRSKVEWPAGDVTTEGTPPYCTPYAAGILQYGNLSDEAKQAFLHRLLKAEPAYGDFEAEAKDRGFGDNADSNDPKKNAILRVWKQVEEYGWDQTILAATNQGRQLKIGWENTTGLGRWGAKKGDAYRPENLTDEALTIDMQILVALQEEAAVAVEAAVASTAVEAHERAGLEETIKAGAGVKISTFRMAVDDAEAKLTKARGALDALPPNKYSSLPCPHCGEAISLVRVNAAETKIEKAEKPPSSAELKERSAAASRAAGEVAGAEAHLVEVKFALEAGEAAVAGATKAQARLAGSGDKTGAEALEEARLAHVEAAGMLDSRRKYDAAHESHRAILNNEKWQAILAPDGVRRTILLRRLKPFNDRLSEMCRTASLGTIRVRGDRTVEMETDRGVLPYPLLSGTEQLLCDSFVQIGIAENDGSELVIIDRFDLLDGPNRTSILKLLVNIDIPCILGCTFSSESLPPRLPQNIGKTYWVSEGLAFHQPPK